MKKLLFIIALIISFNGFAKKVKFAVDLRGLTLLSTGVHVTGDFQAAAGYAGGDWQPNTTKLTQEGTTTIYSIVVDIPAFRKYEYRYVNGDQTYESEFVPEESRVGWHFNDNRWIYIDSLANDTTYMPVLLFSGNAPYGKKLLKLRTGLADEASVDAAGVHVAGTFNNWNYATATMFSFGRKIYEYQAYVDSNASVDYLFVNGNTLAKAETVPATCAVGGKRNKMVVTDFITDTTCYATCGLCVTLLGINDVLFQRSISVYPNPSTGKTQLNFTTTGSRSIQLFTITGMLLSTEWSEGDAYVLNTDKFHTGTYLLVVTDTRNHSIESTSKLMIQQ